MVCSLPARANDGHNFDSMKMGAQLRQKRKYYAKVFFTSRLKTENETGNQMLRQCQHHIDQAQKKRTEIE